MSEWISVKDRLPDDMAMTYLVINGNDTTAYVFHGEEFLEFNEKATHWMPMPDSPNA